MASAALALWGPKARDELWTDSRLKPLDDQLDDSRTPLHDIRTIGWLPEEITTDCEFRTEMGNAVMKLRDITTKLGNESSGDRDELRCDIMQLAHGMLGVAAQLTNIVGIDLYYQLRVPEWRRNWSSQSQQRRRDELAETIAMMASIQSQYRCHTAYRHLFETREDKRDQRLSVEVDAADPTGELLPSIVMVDQVSMISLWTSDGHLRTDQNTRMRRSSLSRCRLQPDDTRRLVQDAAASGGVQATHRVRRGGADCTSVDRHAV